MILPLDVSQVLVRGIILFTRWKVILPLLDMKSISSFGKHQNSIYCMDGDKG